MNIERPKPYIGISGIVDPEQQYYLMDQFAHNALDEPKAGRKLALGVKAVHKTQWLDIENKYGKEWYPVGEESFATALDSCGDGSDVLGVAQTYLDVDYVGDAEYRKEFVGRIVQRGKAWLNAIQFDMLPWHEDETMLPFVEEVKQETGHFVLLQAHGESMEALGAERMVRKLGSYAAYIDYVLFDASHGKGVRMNPSALKPFLEAAYSSLKLEGVGFGVAGGLNAEVVREDLPQLLEDYPDLSWDAEGQLHSESPDGTRPLDSARAKEYLEASAKVIGVYN